MSVQLVPAATPAALFKHAKPVPLLFGQHVCPVGQSNGASLHGVAAVPLLLDEEQARTRPVSPRQTTTSECEIRGMRISFEI